MIGRSQKLSEVGRLIKRAAKVDWRVMILGESDSGKVLIARAIHKNSKESSKPSVAINVSTISENLAESELFGNVKGAFTGAVENNCGKFLSSQGGTLFHDEIGDLKPEIQVKLYVFFKIENFHQLVVIKFLILLVSNMESLVHHKFL